MENAAEYALPLSRDSNVASSSVFFCTQHDKSYYRDCAHVAQLACVKGM